MLEVKTFELCNTQQLSCVIPLKVVHGLDQTYIKSNGLKLFGHKQDQGR